MRFTALTLLLCDYIFEDKLGKSSYMGVFTSVYVPSFPGAIPQFWVGATLLPLVEPDDDLANLPAVEAILVDDQEVWEVMLARLSLPSGFGDAVQRGGATLNLHLQVNGQQFPSAGIYWLVLRASGHEIQRIPFGVALGLPAAAD